MVQFEKQYVKFYKGTGSSRRLYTFRVANEKRARKALTYFGVPSGWYQFQSINKKITAN